MMLEVVDIFMLTRHSENSVAAVGKLFTPFPWKEPGCLFGITFARGLAALWCAFFIDENLRGLIFIRRWKGMK